MLALSEQEAGWDVHSQTLTVSLSFVYGAIWKEAVNTVPAVELLFQVEFVLLSFFWWKRGGGNTWTSPLNHGRDRSGSFCERRAATEPAEERTTARWERSMTGAWKGSQSCSDCAATSMCDDPDTWRLRWFLHRMMGLNSLHDSPDEVSADWTGGVVMSSMSP